MYVNQYQYYSSFPVLEYAFYLSLFHSHNADVQYINSYQKKDTNMDGRHADIVVYNKKSGCDHQTQPKEFFSLLFSHNDPCPASASNISDY